MPKLSISTAMSAITIALSGCGESYPLEAQRYHAAAQEVLMTQKVCADVQDCQRKEILFWEGGNPWIPGFNMAYVTLYETQDEALVEAVVSKLKEVKIENAMPPVKLIVYSSRHSQSKVTFREVAIK